MVNAMLFVIIILVTINIVLVGMAIFGSAKPPDPRIPQLQSDVNDLKDMLLQVQKSVLQIERKMDKELKETRMEVKDGFEQTTQDLSKLIKEYME